MSDNDAGCSRSSQHRSSLHRRDLGRDITALMLLFGTAHLALYVFPDNPVVQSLVQLSWGVTVPLGVATLLHARRRRYDARRLPLVATDK